MLNVIHINYKCNTYSNMKHISEDSYIVLKNESLARNLTQSISNLLWR